METQDSQREIMKILAEMKAQISQITADKTSETALSDKENVPPNEIPAQCSSRSRDGNASSNTNAEALPQSTPPHGGCNSCGLTSSHISQMITCLQCYYMQHLSARDQGNMQDFLSGIH